MSLNKSDFPDQFAYEQAKRDALYVDAEPINPKIASLCVRDQVQHLGTDTSLSVGACEIDGCAYANDKLSGISGACLKATVGIAEVEVNL